MGINPLVLGGIGATVVAAGVGYGLTKANDALIASDPKGTSGDAKAVGVTIGTAFLGVAGGGTLAALGGIGKIHPGFAIGGAALGAGMLVGSIGALIATNVRHGSSVETAAQGVIDKYDRWPGNDSLDLQGSFWSPPETYRSETSSYEDSDGDRHYSTSVYEVTRLAERADQVGNRDDRASHDELRTVIGSFDADGDGRLKGKESRAFDRQYGERLVASYSGQVDNWWDGDDYGYSPTSPGDDYGGGVSPGDDY